MVEKYPMHVLYIDLDRDWSATSNNALHPHVLIEKGQGAAGDSLCTRFATSPAMQD
jgi:hypothetical protein